MFSNFKHSAIAAVAAAIFTFTAVAAAVGPAIASRGHKHVVAVVSGGNVDLARFAQLVGACKER
jgi:threonine dehydratase